MLFRSITLSFIVKGEQASQDLSDWFERGYDWIIDAEVSEGEYNQGKYLVFVEMPRRLSTPERVVELLTDLETLTDYNISDWTIKINDEEYDADPSIIKQLILLSPHEYRQVPEGELNEMRHRAGLKVHNIYGEKDIILKDFIAKAGL